ncbi:MAG: substrate-binding domain-containing protein [Planctomycetaceae bacterium]|nr:substrate-binding domain-containing protein [Planctomycetaceae bacterium]
MSTVGVLASFVLCLAALSGCSSSAPTTEEPRYIVLMNGNSPFWDAVGHGLKKAGEDLHVKAVLETNDATPKGQIDKLRQFSTQSDIAGVAISVTDAANPAIADELKKLRAQGVAVITLDSDLDRTQFADARAAFVGTDNLAGGRALGITAKNIRPDGGAYVQFVGRTGAQNAIERMDGFQRGVGDKFKELDRMGDENDRSKARDNVRNAIRNHPDLNVLVGIWSYNAPAIVDIVKEMNVRDKITVVAFDAEPLAIEAMQAGNVDAMVVQNPFEMGYQGVRLMKALREKDQATISELLPQLGQPGGDLYDTGLKVVVPDEGSPLQAEMFEAKTQFLKLSEFREWLNKFGLTGS